MDSEDKDQAGELLDRVASRLRDTPVPSVPPELLEGDTAGALRVKPKTPRRAIRSVALGLSVAAAVLVVATWIAWQQLRPRDVQPEIVEDPRPPRTAVVTVVTPLSDLEPYSELERKLDSMTAEIATLRQQADLLDAYQRANELLAYDARSSP